MSRTNEQQRAWEQQAYGCIKIDFLASVDDSISVRIARKSNDAAAVFAAYIMVVSSILSDAQEEIARNMNEQARQSINRAKCVMHERVLTIPQRP